MITDNGNTFTVGANTFQIDYNFGGASGAVALVAAVPEPTTATALLAAAGALSVRRRRRA